MGVEKEYPMRNPNPNPFWTFCYCHSFRLEFCYNIIDFFSEYFLQTPLFPNLMSWMWRIWQPDPHDDYRVALQHRVASWKNLLGCIKLLKSMLQSNSTFLTDLAYVRYYFVLQFMNRQSHHMYSTLKRRGNERKQSTP